MDHPTEIIGNEKRVLARLLGGAYGSEDAGDWIGPYRLIERLGEGGFGIVWRADQTEPVQREVALKVIKRGMDTQQVLTRFDQERQSLANMEHPNIAALLDAGASVDGRPYFAMELVHGEPLTHWCEAHHATLPERLSLFHQVCQAVSHAHQKGLIHRDLKPSNILVTSFDGRPVPKIIDFGIAKAMRSSTLEEQSLLTLTDQIVGTPLYMSPEQIEGGQAIDTRSDIYALGVILYELLTGAPPFHSQTSIDQLKRSIREHAPLKPTSKRLKAQRENTSPSALHALPPSDIDLITLNALEKDPARRYQTALDFAEDIQRFLNDEPIHARAPSFTYITGRWIKRHRVASVAAFVFMLAMVSATFISLHQAQLARISQAHAEVQASLALQSEARAKQSATFLTELLERVTAEIEKGRNPEALKLALLGSEQRIAALGTDTDLQLQLLNRVADIYRSIGENKQLIPLLKAAASASAQLNGPTSEAAFKAELVYIKVVTDHGNRSTAPALVADLLSRVETKEDRGSKFWFDVQRELVRAHTKLKQPQPAVAAAEEFLAELAKHKMSTKERLKHIVACVEAFEISGDFERANALLSECMKLNESEPDEKVAALILNQRVHICWSQRDFAGGAVLLREVVAGLKKKHGEQSPEALEKLIQLAEYEIDAREYENALAHGMEALAIAQAHPDAREDLAEALICVAKGEGYNKRYDDAIDHATKAEEIANELGNTKTIHRCATMLAVLHQDAGHLEEAADYYQRVLKIVEAAQANYKVPLEIIGEICSIRARQGRVDEAMKLAQKLWSRLQSEPGSKNEEALKAEIANQCLYAHKAWRVENPAAPEVENLAAWKAASAATKATENSFSRLRKRQP